MLWVPPKPSEDEIKENSQHRIERDGIFLESGIDHSKMIAFVVDAAEPLKAPVLDIGTGKGRTAIEIAGRGARVITVDRSEDELRKAYLNAVEAGVEGLIEFYLSDASGLPFEDGAFDLVTMVNVVHHLDDMESVLPEVSRVLVPGGRFVVSDFTDEGFAILSRIHEMEGHTHDRKDSGGIDGVAEMLPRFGMRCSGRDSRFHQCVMVADKL